MKNDLNHEILRRQAVLRLCAPLLGASWFGFSWFGFSAVEKSAMGVEPSRGVNAAHRQWPVEFKLGRFKIHSDFQVDAVPALQSELLATSREVEELLGTRFENQTVHVVLFGTPQEYARYMQNYFPHIPTRRAIFIQDRGPGMLFAHWHPDIATDLRHESTHALLNDGSAQLPLWLDEGLAEYFEVPSSERFLGSPYLNDVCERAAKGFVPSLKQLEGLGVMAEFTDVRYRDSWSWVHYFVHRSTKTRQLFTNFVLDSRSGATTLALSRQLAAVVPDLNADYQLHFASLGKQIASE